MRMPVCARQRPKRRKLHLHEVLAEPVRGFELAKFGRTKAMRASVRRSRLEVPYPAAQVVLVRFRANKGRLRQGWRLDRNCGIYSHLLCLPDVNDLSVLLPIDLSSGHCLIGGLQNEGYSWISGRLIGRA